MRFEAISYMYIKIYFVVNLKIYYNIYLSFFFFNYCTCLTLWGPMVNAVFCQNFDYALGNGPPMGTVYARPMILHTHTDIITTQTHQRLRGSGLVWRPIGSMHIWPKRKKNDSPKPIFWLWGHPPLKNNGQGKDWWLLKILGISHQMVPEWAWTCLFFQKPPADRAKGPSAPSALLPQPKKC